MKKNHPTLPELFENVQNGTISYCLLQLERYLLKKTLNQYSVAKRFISNIFPYFPLLFLLQINYLE